MTTELVGRVETLENLVRSAQGAANVVAAIVQGGTNLRARGVVAVNVPNLAAFTVAGNDGITYVAGDETFLAMQAGANTVQNGPYIVGPVNAGVAPLTRPLNWATGSVIPLGARIDVGPEGALYKNTTWVATSAAGALVGTTDPNFYPKTMNIVAVLPPAADPAAGSVILGAAHGLWLHSVTESKVLISRRSAGAATAATVQYAAPAANRVAGIVGTAAVLVQAEVAAGTINAADVDTTLDVLVVN